MRNISSLLKTHLLPPAALVGLIVLISATQDANKSQTLQLKPCEVNKLKGNCGALEVFENRATRQGRKIQLQILVVPATGPKREPDPYVYIPGGPGSSAIEDAPYVVQQFKRINEKRELLFVDQRGTGGSHLYLSITCAEDLPWIKPGEDEALAKNTFLGDYRLRQQREACSLWPRAHIEKDYSQPARSALPVLIFTGQWDPVTPPSNGDGVARYLTNSLHVVVPQGGHGFGGLEGLECLERLNVEFVEKVSVKGLDPSCTKNIKRTGFKLAF